MVSVYNTASQINHSQIYYHQHGFRQLYQYIAPGRGEGGWGRFRLYGDLARLFSPNVGIFYHSMWSHCGDFNTITKTEGWIFWLKVIAPRVGIMIKDHWPEGGDLDQGSLPPGWGFWLKIIALMVGIQIKDDCHQGGDF